MAKGAAYNQQAKAWLLRQGYDLCAKVEFFNAHTKRMHDLFQILDFIAVGKGGTVGVQVTSRSNMASRRAKMLAADATPILLANCWRLLLLGLDQPGGPRTQWRVKAEWIAE